MGIVSDIKFTESYIRHTKNRVNRMVDLYWADKEWCEAQGLVSGPGPTNGDRCQIQERLYGAIAFYIHRLWTWTDYDWMRPYYNTKVEKDKIQLFLAGDKKAFNDNQLFLFLVGANKFLDMLESDPKYYLSNVFLDSTGMWKKFMSNTQNIPFRVMP